MFTNQRIGIATYIRISTDEERQDPHKQQEIVNRYVHSKPNYTVVQSEIEETKGWKDVVLRPKLYNILNNPRVKGIVSVRMDRLCRSASPLASLEAWVAEKHFVDFVDGKYWDSNIGAGDIVMQYVEVGLGKAETKKISIRTQQAMDVMPRKEGKRWSEKKQNWVGRPELFIGSKGMGTYRAITQAELGELWRMKQLGYSIDEIALKIRASHGFVWRIIQQERRII